MTAPAEPDSGPHMRSAEPAEFEVWQDDMMQASASGPRDVAWREAMHYAAQYGQDRPVQVFEVTRRLVDPLAAEPADVSGLWPIAKPAGVYVKRDPCAAEPRWYCVSRDGMATWCRDADDAGTVAANADVAWPQNAPHRAVQLVEFAEPPADVAALVGRLRERAARNWPDDDNRGASLFGQAAASLSALSAQVAALKAERRFAGWFHELPSAMSHRLWEQGGHEQEGGAVALYE